MTERNAASRPSIVSSTYSTAAKAYKQTLAEESQKLIKPSLPYTGQIKPKYDGQLLDQRPLSTRISKKVTPTSSNSKLKIGLNR